MAEQKTIKDRRFELHEMLKSLIQSSNVYYQPPESTKMKYPAIRYSRKKIDNNYADNSIYAQHHAYELVVIDADPDSEIVTKVSKLPTCRFDRTYSVDNLNHTIFTIYY